MKNLKKSLS